MRRVAEPHSDLVALVTHRNNGAVDVLAGVVERLPDEAEHHLEPEVVEAPHPLFLVQVDEPPVMRCSRIGVGYTRLVQRGLRFDRGNQSYGYVMVVDQG